MAYQAKSSERLNTSRHAYHKALNVAQEHVYVYLSVQGGIVILRNRPKLISGQ